MSPFAASLKRAFSQRAFVVTVVLMVIFAAGLNTAVAVFANMFHKKAVPLRVASLKEGIPEKLGHWVSVSPDKAIDPEVEQVLGTSEYIFRDYVDTRKIAPADVAALKNAAPNTRQAMLASMQATNPSAIMRVAVTYYTGLVDTVAHVPERCYVADGFEVKQYEKKLAALGNYPDGKPRDVEYRFLAFEDQTGVGGQVQRVARNVGYVFNCNGKYLSGANDVRLQLQNPFEQYAYYAKIELMTAALMTPAMQQGVTDVNDKNESEAAMESFLADALPEVEKCLADWQELHKKK